MNERVSNFIAVTVTLVWALSFILDAIPGVNYEPPAAINAIMTVVAGAAFTKTLIERNKPVPDPDPDPDPPVKQPAKRSAKKKGS